MTPERIVELRERSYKVAGIAECLDEIERLRNITTIQQKQIERLMAARDAERVKCEGLLKDLEKADSLLKALEKQVAQSDFWRKDKQ